MGLHGLEAEPCGDLLAGQVEVRHPVAGGAPERRDVGLRTRVPQRIEVGGEGFAVAERPERDRGGHGALEVRVAGHQHVGVLLGEGAERPAEVGRSAAEVFEAVAQEETEGGQHLVVAGAARVDLLAGLAQPRCQELLDHCMAVLVFGADRDLPACRLLGQRIQPLLDAGPLLVGEDAEGVEAVGVRARGDEVVRQQEGIPPEVLADGEAGHPVLGAGVFLPEHGHRTRRPRGRLIRSRW